MKLIRLAVADALRAAAVERDAQLNHSTISRYSPTGAALCAFAISMTVTRPFVMRSSNGLSHGAQIIGTFQYCQVAIPHFLAEQQSPYRNCASALRTI